ncbi:PREDICTED: LEM domain-containing protein Bocksbeutel [Drosophila arizonae]|uniref:LEM domain-containing protein Bocksbeutel n=1 Tax=Drosophila arizonae TaxID=7263 RepID=A0ABM1P4V0_DROAR|nr:PREDICTED: LEM domain-containing protein Bocksbeutel [Drosophila arizonae]
MSDLSYLETISNKELHAKCLEYGLPNIPVTDTSRKVILRRLRNTILGTENKKTAATKSPRRETVHSSKATPTDATNANEPRSADKAPRRNNNINNTRRTIAATPQEYYPLESSSVRSVQTTTTVSDVGSSEDDDYYYQINTPTSLKSQRDDSRQRRSVSLSKSGVLTTSYTREVEKPHYEEEPDEEPQSYTYQRPQATTTAPAFKLPVYEQPIERSYRPELSRQNLTQSQLNSTSYSEAPNEFPETRMQQAYRNTFSGSAAPFNAANTTTTSGIRQRPSHVETGAARARLPTYKVNTLYPQLNDFYDQHNNSIEPMDTESDSEYEPETQRQPQQQRSSGGNLESPYLSHFSRQLDTRKRSSPLARPQIRTTVRQEDPNATRQKFRELMESLDRQYNLKFYFCLTVAVILATLIYVIVTPAV